MKKTYAEPELTIFRFEKEQNVILASDPYVDDPYDDGWGGNII